MHNVFRTDYHIHITAWRGKDPAMTVENAVRRAHELGHVEIGLLEHLAPSRGRPIDALEYIRDELAKVEIPNGLRVRRGVEIDVTSEGTLEGPEDVRGDLSLDYVIAAVHGAPSGVPDDEVIEDNHRRMLAVLGGAVRFEVLAHPWRSVLRRAAQAAGCELTFELVPRDMQAELIAACVEKDVAIEVNAGATLDDPAHDVFLKNVLSAGLKLAIGSDAHFLRSLGDSEQCVVALRRIDAAPEDIWRPVGM